VLKYRFWLKIGFSLLLVAGMTYLVKVGVADFLRLRPCAYIDGVRNGTVQLDASELDKARAQLLLAQSWDSSNAVIPEYLGQTDFMLAKLLGFNPGLQSGFLRKAIANLDAAVTLRPYSAYLWAARMTMGSWLLEIDTNVRRDSPAYKKEVSVISIALQRSAVLDPWNPAILQQIIKVGKLRYSDFSVEIKTVVDESVIRANHLNVNI